MQTIKSGDDRTVKIIGRKSLDKDSDYRLSLFTYMYSENNIYIIQNTLTFEITELTSAEWEALQKIKNATATGSYIAENGLEPLVAKHYIVKNKNNDTAQYQQICFLLKTMLGRKKGYSTYVIFPTTSCNARCVYCYEEGYPVKTMSVETALHLVDFICETRHDGEVKLRWFGGEPLSAKNIITQICTELHNRGISYKSTMITNASLMTKELAHEAKELWHLNKVQISLDGTKEDYAIRKNYYSPDRYNYDVVMQAVHFLADEGIKVKLRVNVDFGNIAGIEGFLNDIKAEFGDMNNISLYLAPLYQVQKSDECLMLYKEIFRLTDYQKEIGIPYTSSDNETSHLRANHCMADIPDKSIVITPEGIFNNCEHLPEFNTWGNIFDGVTNADRYKELCAQSAIDTQCAKCPFLPECTPFYKNGCPGWFEKCYEYHCMRTEHMLHELLKSVKAIPHKEQAT